MVGMEWHGVKPVTYHRQQAGELSSVPLSPLTSREAGIPAEMEGGEPDRLRQILHRGRKAVDEEAVRIRNQIPKPWRIARPVSPKWPCPSV